MSWIVTRHDTLLNKNALRNFLLFQNDEDLQTALNELLKFQKTYEYPDYAVFQGGNYKPTAHGNFSLMQPIYARLRERARQIVAGLPSPDFYREHQPAATYARQFLKNDPILIELQQHYHHR